MTDKDFEELLHVIEFPATDENPLVFHHSDHVDQWIAQNISALR